MQKTTKNCNKLQVSNNQFPNTTSNQNPPYWFIKKKKKNSQSTKPKSKIQSFEKPLSRFYSIQRINDPEQEFQEKKKKKKYKPV